MDIDVTLSLSKEDNSIRLSRFDKLSMTGKGLRLPAAVRRNG